MPISENASLNPLALEALINHQRQLDIDGVEVGVSRQALDELIAAYTALSASPSDAERHERAVPVGWQLVPKEITEGMNDAGKPWHGHATQWQTQQMFDAMLAAAPPPPAAAQEPAAVKALEWEICGTKSSYHGGPYDKAWSWSAKGAGLFYQIITQPEADKPYLLLLFKNYATLDEAKAAAQADYETRIRSALSPSQSDPAPEKMEAARELRNFANTLLNIGGVTPYYVSKILKTATTLDGNQPDERFSNIEERISSESDLSCLPEIAALREENERLREALEPFALISSEGVIKAQKGYVSPTTQAEYFHRASAAIQHAAKEKLG